VNVEHLRAFLWLRWRIRLNQLKRGGAVNAVIAGILLACAVLLGAGLFFVFFFIGLLALRDSSPVAVVYTWAGLVAAYLLVWLAGLTADLQRSEALSLDKFLHLPVSLEGVFLVNYLSSLLSVSLVILGPAMLGLGVGMLLGRGPAMLLLFPLLTAFLLTVTALTYQFQGWLAALMVNKRRRRTIVVVLTMGVVLLSQLPNLLNLTRSRRGHQPDESAVRKKEREAELNRAFQAKEITQAEYQRRSIEISQKQLEEMREANLQQGEQVERTIRLACLVLPPGWLPLGAGALTGGDVVPALLATLGLALIGSASLWRAYRTTVRIYTGQLTSGKRREAAAAPKAAFRAKGGSPRPLLVEKDLPGVSEHVAAIALSSFRSLTRAPEAKMMLLSPVILLVIFGSMFLTGAVEPSEPVRPLLVFGAMAMLLFTMVGVVGNQFGFDRGGFRVYVLCPARRRDLLLGKNLAFAPLALGMGLATAVLVQALYPMRLDHFLAVLPTFLSMYLLFCLLANLLSILAPMPVASGALRPTNPKGLAFLLQLAFLLLFPTALAPTLLPLGLEALLEGLGVLRDVPICLLLSLLVCLAVVALYRLALNWEGSLLQAREQAILTVVTSKVE
jgi:hypothetical protein